MLRGIIFDLFHTLTAAESEWGSVPWTSDALGIPRPIWHDALIQRSRWRLTGEVTDPVQIVRALAHSIDPSLPEERILEAAAFRQQRHRQALTRVPPANLHLLSELRARGFRLGLLSNADASEVSVWSESPLAGCFDAEVFSCAVGMAKPEPAIYQLCLSRLGLRPDECAFVGDGGSNELLGARQVGLYSVFFSGVMQELWPERIAGLAEVADVHIGELQELLSLPAISSGAALAPRIAPDAA